MPSSSAVRSGRVLVVDGDAVSRFLLRSWFQRWKVPCELFADPNQALGYLPSSDFSLVLVEYHLGQGNTVQGFAGQLRAIVEAEGLPVPNLALHTSDDSIRPFARRERFDFFLLKPLMPSDLLHVLLNGGCRPEPSEQQAAELNPLTEWRVALR